MQGGARRGPRIETIASFLIACRFINKEVAQDVEALNGELDVMLVGAGGLDVGYNNQQQENVRHLINMNATFDWTVFHQIK